MLDAIIMAADLRMIFIQKAVATGYCIELALGMATLAMAAWSIACIRQPNDPLSCKHSNFLGIGIYQHFPGL